MAEGLVLYPHFQSRRWCPAGWTRPGSASATAPVPRLANVVVLSPHPGLGEARCRDAKLPDRSDFKRLG